MKFLFSNFRWYRKWRGGTWYYVEYLPSISGGFREWSQTILTAIRQRRIIKTETW